MDRREFIAALGVLGLNLAIPYNPVHDPEAEAYINALERYRIVLNAEKEAIRSYIQWMKTEGHWAKLDCFYTFTDPQTATINWKNPNSLTL